MPDKDADPRIAILLEILEQDRQHVMLYVAVCFAVPVFALSELAPAAASLALRATFLGSLSSFIGAGLSFFLYAQRINWKRLQGIQNIMDGDAAALRQTLFGLDAGVWTIARGHYRRGSVLLFTGSILFVLYVVLYLF